jgi:hypothetical protein
MASKAEIQENTKKLIDFVCRKFTAGELDNNSLVELFKATGAYLNLQTISDYARDNNMSYEGVKKCRRIEVIYGVKFVIDND